MLLLFEPVSEVTSVEAGLGLQCAFGYFWVVEFHVLLPASGNVVKVKFLHRLQSELRIAIVFEATDCVKPVVFYECAWVRSSDEKVG